MNFANELKQLLQAYATKTTDPVLVAKSDAMVQLRNPNDVRVMAFDVLRHVFDDRRCYLTQTSTTYLFQTF